MERRLKSGEDKNMETEQGLVYLSGQLEKALVLVHDLRTGEAVKRLELQRKRAELKQWSAEISNGSVGMKQSGYSTTSDALAQMSALLEGFLKIANNMPTEATEV